MADEEKDISKRDDTNPKEGADKYGDVKFADEKNKKYPIDTEEHIRAAWNYINKSDNAGKYDPAEVATIKRAIVAAWKDKIAMKLVTAFLAVFMTVSILKVAIGA